MNRILKRQRRSPVYEAKTRDILVRVVADYLPGQSDPIEHRFAWSYTIEIENHGLETVQLVSRHWSITDGYNQTEEVKGVGVVGEQPRLKPREAFRYTSGCPLTTPTGAMSGRYQMLTDEGDVFDVEIPAFSLHLPDAHKKMN